MSDMDTHKRNRILHYLSARAAMVYALSRDVEFPAKLREITEDLRDAMLSLAEVADAIPRTEDDSVYRFINGTKWFGTGGTFFGRKLGEELTMLSNLTRRFIAGEQLSFVEERRLWLIIADLVENGVNSISHEIYLVHWALEHSPKETCGSCGDLPDHHPNLAKAWFEEHPEHKESCWPCGNAALGVCSSSCDGTGKKAMWDPARRQDFCPSCWGD